MNPIVGMGEGKTVVIGKIVVNSRNCLKLANAMSYLLLSINNKGKFEINK